MTAALPRGQLEALIRGRVLYEEPMSRHTTFRIGGPADLMVFPQDLDDLKALLRVARAEGIPSLVLGGGSNMLVREGGIRGLVICLHAILQHLSAEGEKVTAGASVRVSRLLAFCSRRGLTGLETLTGIPGTVGAAVWGNSGAYGGATADRLEAVRILTREGREEVRERRQMAFAYRRSAFPEGSVILEATFALERGDPAEIRRTISKFLVQRNATQPVEYKSAGSIFKNPPGEFAGRLVESVGLKGLQIGGAMISPKHGNFIVNTGGASARDVLALIARARERVRAETGITLELEVRVVGED